MIKVCLAELNTQIENRFSLIEQMCRAYLTSFSRPDITVSVTEEEIRAEGEGSLPYLETLAVYRKISERLLDYDGFLMHGAVLEIDGTGVAFLAKKEVLPRLLGQVYLPKSPEKLSKTMDLIGNLLECSDCYIIRCNMELSAAEMAYQALFQS